MAAKRNGWIAFLAWTVAAAVLTFAVLSAPSVGLFVLPVALIGFLLVARTARIWPESLGTLAGVGLMLLFVAFVNRSSVPCPPSGSIVRMAPGESSSCGGRNPAPWLLIGATLVCAAVASYGLSSFRRGLTDG